MSDTLTLWDLIKPLLRRKPPAPTSLTSPAHPAARAPAVAAPSAPARRRAAAKPALSPAAERYERVTREMLDRYQIRVRKWRTSMSGIAWYVTYKDGRVQRLIEAPRPRGPMSAAVFLHEVGHHAIGFHTYKPRCLEEYHAWRWALEAMEANGLNITDSVRRRMHASLWYAVEKAKRRGIREIPAELTPFLERPPSRRR